MNDLLFHLAFAALVTHELDAVHRHEWRLLFVLRTMPDEAARRTFILIHVPLLATLFWLVAYPVESVSFWTMLGLDVFMIVHADLHRRLSSHPKYEFHTPTSRFIIYGAAVLAAVHLFSTLFTQSAP